MTNTTQIRIKMMINVILTERVVLNQIAILMIPDVVGISTASIHQMTTFQRRAINILMTTHPPEILTLNLEKVENKYYKVNVILRPECFQYPWWHFEKEMMV